MEKITNDLYKNGDFSTVYYEVKNNENRYMPNDVVVML